MPPTVYSGLHSFVAAEVARHWYGLRILHTHFLVDNSLHCFEVLVDALVGDRLDVIVVSTLQARCYPPRVQRQLELRGSGRCQPEDEETQTAQLEPLPVFCFFAISLLIVVS